MKPLVQPDPMGALGHELHPELVPLEARELGFCASTQPVAGSGYSDGRARRAGVGRASPEQSSEVLGAGVSHSRQSVEKLGGWSEMRLKDQAW